MPLGYLLGVSRDEAHCLQGIATRYGACAAEPAATMATLRRQAACLGLLLAIVSVSAASATARALRACVSVTADPDRPLRLRFSTRPTSEGPAETAYANLRRTGARFVRTFVNWELVAPGGASKPGGFDAKDPGDPAYDWTSLDGQVRMATQKGFAPIVYVQTAPQWAQAVPGHGLSPESQRSSHSS